MSLSRQSWKRRAFPECRLLLARISFSHLLSSRTPGLLRLALGYTKKLRKRSHRSQKSQKVTGATKKPHKPASHTNQKRQKPQKPQKPPESYGGQKATEGRTHRSQNVTEATRQLEKPSNRQGKTRPKKIKTNLKIYPPLKTRRVQPRPSWRAF